MRLEPRVQVRVPLRVQVGDDREAVVLETENLSPSGALCRSPRRLELDEELAGQIVLDGEPGGSTVQFEAVVLREQEPLDGDHDQVVALHFVRISARDRDVLRRFVFARQVSQRSER